MEDSRGTSTLGGVHPCSTEVVDLSYPAFFGLSVSRVYPIGSFGDFLWLSVFGVLLPGGSACESSLLLGSSRRVSPSGSIT